MSEKDTIENTDKSVDKAENKQLKNTAPKDKPIESKKSDQENNVQEYNVQGEWFATDEWVIDEKSEWFVRRLLSV